MRPETDTSATVCSSISKHLVLKIFFHDNYSTAAFNVVNNSETDELTKVLSSVVEAQKGHKQNTETNWKTNVSNGQINAI